MKPGGGAVVLTDQPLEGQVPWPGIVLDSGGVVVDWPGWHLEGSVWVEGDEFDWAVGDLTVEFDAGASASRVVSYPASTDTCIPTPEGAVSAGGATPTPTPAGTNGAGVGSDDVSPPPTSTAGPLPATNPAGMPIALLLLIFVAAFAAAASTRVATPRPDRAR
jgi:hypothetical protein